MVLRQTVTGNPQIYLSLTIFIFILNILQKASLLIKVTIIIMDVDMSIQRILFIAQVLTWASQILQ